MSTHAKRFLDQDFAFRRGQKAFRDGEPQSSNPYETGGQSLAAARANTFESIAHDNWDDGYIWQSCGCPEDVEPTR